MQRQQTSDKYAQSGVYKLTCPDCKKAFVGQTGRNFAVRFNEQKNAFKTNSHASNYAKDLIEQAHSFSSIQNTMQILQHHSEGAHLNTIARYYIYAEFTKNNHLNDEPNISPNKIFDALLKSHQP
jgi:hypothetical protein